jgi:hypothetical protein
LTEELVGKFEKRIRKKNQEENPRGNFERKAWKKWVKDKLEG